MIPYILATPGSALCASMPFTLYAYALYTYAYTHACVHAYTHPCVHAYTHAYAPYAYAHAYTFALCSYAYACSLYSLYHGPLYLYAYALFIYTYTISVPIRLCLRLCPRHPYVYTLYTHACAHAYAHGIHTPIPYYPHYYYPHHPYAITLTTLSP
jgi:hypothetical protein